MAEPPRVPMLQDVLLSTRVQSWIRKANEQMAAIGYTEHGHRHASIVAKTARRICLERGLSQRMAELAAIAGYLHDIGCMIHRTMHPQLGAALAMRLLDEMGFDPDEIADVAAAIANHEEPEGVPITPMAAAVIIADKSDVHISRVQSTNPADYDIHDMVNHACSQSRVVLSGPENPVIQLDLKIDTGEASLMKYFEIFLDRMIMCRKAAAELNAAFKLTINDVEI